MADEETPTGPQCQCVKWHAPKPTRLGKFEVEGETIHVCPATYTAVSDALQIYTRSGGKPSRNDLKVIPKFARDLAARVWLAKVIEATQAQGGEETQPATEPAPQPEPEPETQPETPQEPTAEPAPAAEPAEAVTA